MTRIVDQRGVTLIAAVFAVMGLAVLGLIAVQLMVVTSQQQIRSWNAEQSLYAAESGVDWAAWQINAQGTCAVASSDQVVETGTSVSAWFDITGVGVDIDGRPVCRITATGKAGGSASSPDTTRQINVLYRAVVVE